MRFVVPERMATIMLSALVAHTGWHWMLERGDRMRQYRIQWPVVSTALLASAMRWLMLMLIVAGIVWLVGVLRRPGARNAEHGAAGARD